MEFYDFLCILLYERAFHFQDPRRASAASTASAAATLPHRLKMAYPPSLASATGLSSHRPNVELKHTGGSNCRLHISTASAASVKSGLRPDTTSSLSSNSISETQFDSPSAAGSSSSAASRTSAASTIQPHQTASAAASNNTVRRNLKPKLTTFCSPEAQIMESPMVARKSPQIEMSQSGNPAAVVNLASPHETTSILMNK